jgi:hypothetical protein
LPQLGFHGPPSGWPGRRRPRLAVRFEEVFRRNGRQSVYKGVCKTSDVLLPKLIFNRGSHAESKVIHMTRTT